MRPDQTDAGSRNSLLLQIVAQRANGARAGGSDGDEQRDIHRILLEEPRHMACCAFHLRRVRAPMNE
jgi:hypothetical protein